MGRGPSYPYINLEQAIGVVQKVWDYTKRSAAPVSSIVTEALGSSPTSSGTQKTLAAIKAFGLIEEIQSPNGNTARVTDRAIRILLNEKDSPERAQALKDAALSPKWYQFCWEEWGREMPASMKSRLLIEHHFVESTVDGFLDDFKKTMEFAKITDPTEPPPPPASKPLAEPIKKPDSKLPGDKTFKVGDYIQWESQGVLRLPVARRLSRLSEDGAWAWVEGSDTGIPADQLIPAAEPLDPPPPPPFKATLVRDTAESKGIKMRQEVFTLKEDEGDITIQFPATLSAESFEDFKDWLEILKRKVNRSVKAAGSRLEVEVP